MMDRLDVTDGMASARESGVKAEVYLCAYKRERERERERINGIRSRALERSARLSHGYTVCARNQAAARVY